LSAVVRVPEPVRKSRLAYTSAGAATGCQEEAHIALFVARHRHAPEDCPARPGRGELLLSRVSAAVAARHGVTIEAEAFIGAPHVLLLVVEAASLAAVKQFLAFLPDSGDLMILPAFTAEEAVEHGGCEPSA
jgi:hypothetical protein